MTLEIWVALGAGILLVVAIAAQGLALFRPGGRWNPIAVGATAGAAVALVVALVLAAMTQGGWSPLDLRQMALGLALATLLVHLGLAWRSRVIDSGLVVGLVALMLILMAVVVIHPGSPPLSCVQCAVPFQVQWVLFLVGAGASTVAGSTGLTLALHAWLAERGGDPRLARRAGWRTDLCISLRRATRLALAALGSGLTVGVWWAWRTVGMLSNADPRQEWMAITWLVAAMSLLAWRLEVRPARWAAGLAVASAAAALFGLLILMDLRRLL